MSISWLAASTVSTSPAAGTSTPTAASTSNPSNASVQAGDAVDAGVVATLGAAASDPAAGLYTNLANLAAASTASGTPPSSTDVNADWATAVKADPGLAPLAVQMSLNKALLNAQL